MSSITTNIDLKTIKAPSLTSSEYGKNIKEQFDNIDDNFRRISNHDYVTGKSGANIRVADLELVVLNTNNTIQDFTELGWKLLADVTGATDIESYWDDNTKQLDPEFYNDDHHPELSPITVTDEEGTTRVVQFYDCLKSIPSITVFYTLDDVDDPTSGFTYICSPQVYTFLDQRYANSEEQGGVYGDTEMLDYNFDKLKDISCFLTLKYVTDNSVQTPVFTRSNLFPTLYYKNGEFKWRIYDNETGIRAMGPQGASGQRAAVWLAQVSTTDQLDIVEGEQNTRILKIIKLSYIDENNVLHWRDISSIPEESRPKQGDICIALMEAITNDSDDSSDDELKDAFISPILAVSQNVTTNYYVYTNSRNAINQNLSLNSLKCMLLEVGGTDNLLGGLYVPYTVGDKRGAHFIYSTEDFQNVNTLHLVPKSNTNVDLDFANIEGNPTDNNAKLGVEYNEVEINASTKTGINTQRLEVESKFVTINNGGTITIESDNSTICSKKLYSDNSINQINIVTDSNQDTKKSYTEIKSNNAYVKVGGTGSDNDYVTIKGGNTTTSQDSKITLNRDGVQITNSYSDSARERVTINSSGVTVISESDSADSPTDNLRARVNGISNVYVGCPIGTIVMWPSSTIPSGWLLCDGSCIRVEQNVYTKAFNNYGENWSEYDNLVSVLKNNFGNNLYPASIWSSVNWVNPHPSQGGGPGEYHYIQVPKLSQRFPIGAGSDLKNGVLDSGTQSYAHIGLGQSGGESEVRLTTGQLPSHDHTTGKGGVSSGSGNPVYILQESTSGSGHVNSTGEDHPHNNMPPYLALNFIIKYK